MMCNYYESNAERYAAETFTADMSKQYQRFLPRAVYQSAKSMGFSSWSLRT